MKITCIGDSIRIQYVPEVKEILGEDFEIFAPEGNCRFAKYTLRGIFDWKKDMHGSRIVHWNNGLWDVCNLFGDGLFTSEEEYVENMLRIAKILKAEHEVVIFATTTPVSEKNVYNKNSDIRRYNEILVPKLQEMGIIINDLYSAVAENIDEYISEDNIHMSESGIALCARLVAEAIQREAAKLPKKEIELSPELGVDDISGAPVIFENN